jgi:hypothetical protein
MCVSNTFKCRTSCTYIHTCQTHVNVEHKYMSNSFKYQTWCCCTWSCRTCQIVFEKWLWKFGFNFILLAITRKTSWNGLDGLGAIDSLRTLEKANWVTSNLCCFQAKKTSANFQIRKYCGHPFCGSLLQLWHCQGKKIDTGITRRPLDAGCWLN